MRSKGWFVGFMTACTMLALPSCNKSTTPIALGNWLRTSTPQFPGPRSGAFCFTIGNTAYAGLGYGGFHGTTGVGYRLDSYKFVLENGFWSGIAPFPGELREKAVSFAVFGKGYVGTGYNKDSTNHYIKDFWEYNPVTDHWKQLHDFPGPARANAVAFADEHYGYVGTGYDGTYYNDFWQYDPALDTWKQIDFPGGARERALTITIGKKVYLCTGRNRVLPDMWQFDPASQRWTDVTPLSTDAQYANFKLAVNRYDAVGFSLNGMGYVVTGQTPPYQTSIYQYDPLALTWTKMTPFSGAARSQAVAFVIGGRAYVGTGENDAFYFDDIEEFQPF